MPSVVNRPTTRFLLEVDGAAVSGLRQFTGLAAEADIALTKVAGEATAKKHVANFRWTPGAARVGTGMGKGMYEWIKAALAQSAATRKDGVFKLADANGKVQSALNFSGGLVTAVTVPACDATANKTAGVFELAFQAEQVRWLVGSGEALAGKIGGKTKEWLTSNFKLSIGKLPCARVIKVDAFTWRCEAAAAGVGGTRVGTVAAPQVTVPDLKLTIGMADFPAWAEAARKWFVDGQRLEADEMLGRITLLDPSLNDANALGSIDLFNVGFKKFSLPEADSSSDALATFSVELYVEKMGFTLTAFEP